MGWKWHNNGPRTTDNGQRRYLAWLGLAVPLLLPLPAPAAPPTVGLTAAGLVGQGQFGTIKGRLVWGGAEIPPVKVLQEKGKATQDTEVCAKDKPILSRELAVDP